MTDAPEPAAFAEPRPAEGTTVANLDRWGTAWQASARRWEGVELEPGQTCNGSAMQYPGLFVAVYASTGRVWLQAGPTTWDASNVERVQQLSETLNAASYELQFADGARTTVELKMPPDVCEIRSIDPTYDEIDSLGDDIMKTFPYVATDGWTAGGTMRGFLANVLPLWASGFRHGP